MKVIAVVAGLVSAFWVFYALRLFVVTGFLLRVRPGGHGAYIGAVAFPVLAVIFGWLAVYLWRRPGVRSAG